MSSNSTPLDSSIPSSSDPILIPQQLTSTAPIPSSRARNLIQSTTGQENSPIQQSFNRSPTIDTPIRSKNSNRNNNSSNRIDNRIISVQPSSSAPSIAESFVPIQNNNNSNSSIPSSPNHTHNTNNPNNPDSLSLSLPGSGRNSPGPVLNLNTGEDFIPSEEPLLGNSNYVYYRGYEKIIENIQRRRNEEKLKSTVLEPFPAKKQRIVFILLFLFISIAITLLLVFFWPRPPQWEISSVSLSQFDYHNGDDYGNFHLYIQYNVWNGNFLSTGIDEIDSFILINSTLIGPTISNRIRLPSRQYSQFILDCPFMIPVKQFQYIEHELSSNNNILSLRYNGLITANEVFRLRSMEIDCQWNLKITPTIHNNNNNNNNNNQNNKKKNTENILNKKYNENLMNDDIGTWDTELVYNQCTNSERTA